MTITIKLESALEEQLRQRASAMGCSTSEVVRSALQVYLSSNEDASLRSPFELGADLFGRHWGAADLSTRRRLGFVAAAVERHARRR